jgi:hypothetical protein
MHYCLQKYHWFLMTSSWSFIHHCFKPLKITWIFFPSHAPPLPSIFVFHSDNCTISMKFTTKRWCDVTDRSYLAVNIHHICFTSPAVPLTYSNTNLKVTFPLCWLQKPNKFPSNTTHPDTLRVIHINPAVILAVSRKPLTAQTWVQF